MANVGKWNTPAVTTVLSTALNALTSGTMSAASSTITNSSSLNLYADIEVNLTALSPTTGAYVALYIWESVDTSNFPAQSDGDLRLTTTQLLAVVPLGTASSTAQRVVVRNVVLPAGDFQIKLDNQAGVALGATSNTVKFNTYNVNLNG